MFLIAISKTKFTLDLECQSYNIHSFKMDSSVISIVTDNFLSELFLKEDGFSLVESPLLPHKEFEDIIFSQVIYNKETKCMEILKSTISGRTIYYHIDSNDNFFCSTHIFMLRKAGVVLEENIDVLPEFFYFGNIMAPATLYKNIKKLPTGSRLKIKLENGRCREYNLHYYIPPLPDEKMDDRINSISNSTYNLLNESIKALNPKKDRISVLLSGGLDSSILFKICKNNYGVNNTYSTGYPFEDPNLNNEKKYALSAADALQTKHQYYEVTTDDYLRGVINAISAAEEPLLNMQSAMLYLFFKDGIPQNKNLIINGQGADGIWGLAIHHIIYRNDKLFYRLISKYPIINLLKKASSITGRGGTFIDSLNSTNTNNKCTISDLRNIDWTVEIDKEWVCNYFGRNESEIIKDRYNSIIKFEGRSIYDLISLYDLIGDISSAQSIFSKLGESQRKIVYFPYTHDKLLNFAFSIPWKLKLKKPKNILMEVARQCKIPEFIMNRRKHGFEVTEKKWADIEKILEPLVPLAVRVFDEEQIRNIQSTDSKKKATLFWFILNYSIWKRLCINNEPVEILLDELNQKGVFQGSNE